MNSQVRLRRYPMIRKIFGTSRSEMQKAAAHLQDHGWAVVGPILGDAKTLAAHRGLFFKDVAAIPGYPKSSDPAKFPSQLPRGFAGYLIRGNNLPNGELAWSIRQNTTIRRMYATIHQVESPSALCTAMDAVFAGVRGRSVKGLVLHRDADKESETVSFSAKSLSVQSIFTFTPVESQEVSGTVLIPGSHKVVQPGNDRKVSTNLQEQYRAYCIKPVVPADHLLLFNSRTIHGSTPELSYGSDVLTRLAVPVQFDPKAWRSSTTLEKKRKAYLDQRGSSANPTKHFRLMNPNLGESTFASQHGYPHRCCRIPAKLIHGRIPPEIDGLL